MRVRTFIYVILMLVFGTALAVPVAQRVLAGQAIGKAAQRLEPVGLDMSDCQSFRMSPYVTGDGRCLKRPVQQIMARMPKIGPDEERPQEERPLD